MEPEVEPGIFDSVLEKKESLWVPNIRPERALEVYLSFRGVAPRYENPNPPIRSIKIAAVIPDNSTAEIILGSRDFVKDLDSVAARYDKLERAKVFRSGRGIDLLRDFHNAEDGNILVLIGHSRPTKEGRRAFVFPDGSAVPFPDIHNYGRENGLHLVIVSCHSPDVALQRKVSYVEALASMERLDSQFSALGAKEDLIQRLKEDYRRTEAVEVGLNASWVMAVGIGAGASIMAIGGEAGGDDNDDDNDDDENVEKK